MLGKYFEFRCADGVFSAAEKILMRKISMSVLLMAVLGFGSLGAQKPNTNSVVEKLDPAFDAIVPANAKMEI